MENCIHFWAERCRKYALFRIPHRISDKKGPLGHMSISLRSGARGLERWYGWNFKLYRNRKLHSLLGWTQPKYTLFRKRLQIKIFWHRISDKKVCEGICLSSPGVKLGASKEDMVEKSECIFLFLYNLIFQPYRLWSPQFHSGGDRHMPSWTFLSKIRYQKTFIWTFFLE